MRIVEMSKDEMEDRMRNSRNVGRNYMQSS